MNFPRLPSDTAPPDLELSQTNLDGTLMMQMVKTVPTYKYLGILFDSRLRWSAHAQKVAATMAWWSQQVARLSRISGGANKGGSPPLIPPTDAPSPRTGEISSKKTGAEAPLTPT
ncbi:hypothetical protein C0989_004913 [Termitomyces sp. Mn162]|nr:hypothetical protein C0989_004913 [Termitomyces sp. Mn162]